MGFYWDPTTLITVYIVLLATTIIITIHIFEAFYWWIFPFFSHCNLFSYSRLYFPSNDVYYLDTFIVIIFLLLLFDYLYCKLLFLFPFNAVCVFFYFHIQGPLSNSLRIQTNSVSSSIAATSVDQFVILANIDRRQSTGYLCLPLPSSTPSTGKTHRHPLSMECKGDAILPTNKKLMLEKSMLI